MLMMLSFDILLSNFEFKYILIKYNQTIFSIDFFSKNFIVMSKHYFVHYRFVSVLKNTEFSMLPCPFWIFNASFPSSTFDSLQIKFRLLWMIVTISSEKNSKHLLFLYFSWFYFFTQRKFEKVLLQIVISKQTYYHDALNSFSFRYSSKFR